MPIVNGYCTQEQLLNALRRDTKETVYFDLLEDCVNRASRDIDRYTGRIFYTKSIASELFDSYAWSDNELCIDQHSSNRKILFPSPIISVTSVIEDNITLTDGDDYYIYKKQGYIEKSGEWTTNRKSSSNNTGIVITASFGYASTPPEIENICIELAKVYSGLDSRIITNEKGMAEAQLGTKIPRWIQERLKWWRRLSV
jgi:hypothetical protein